MTHRISRRHVNAGIGAALVSPAVSPALASTAAFAQGGGTPIKIGFSMAQTGALAGAGKQALLGAQIWEEETNAKGGLLGRPVKLIYYDDQTKPDSVPGIYAKLLDVDKVDLVIGPYGTNLVAPAIPSVMGKGKVLVGLFALDANHDFHYPRYFSMLPSGPTPKQSFTDGFFEIAAAQNPKPQTVAITAEDAEFSRNAAEGARENVHKYGLKIVYDRTYPPNTTDFSPIIRAIQATNPELVVICSYPNTSVGMVQTASELGLKPKMMGGGMVGIQYTAIKSKLKSRLNGIVNYEFWVPTPKLMAPAADFFKKYQARASAEGVDPLGYYLGGWGYAYFQVLQQAVEGTKGLNDDKLAEYMRTHAFSTIMNPEIKFGKDGEWTKSAVMQVQYHDITDSANLDTWRGMSYQTVLTPGDQKTGDVIYPYERASG